MKQLVMILLAVSFSIAEKHGKTLNGKTRNELETDNKEKRGILDIAVGDDFNGGHYNTDTISETFNSIVHGSSKQNGNSRSANGRSRKSSYNVVTQGRGNNAGSYRIIVNHSTGAASVAKTKSNEDNRNGNRNTDSYAQENYNADSIWKNNLPLGNTNIWKNAAITSNEDAWKNLVNLNSHSPTSAASNNVPLVSSTPISNNENNDQSTTSDNLDSITGINGLTNALGNLALNGGGADNQAPKEYTTTTVTVYKDIHVPYPVEKQIPVPVEKIVPYPVSVLVPQPYPVQKIIHEPYNVYVKVPYPIHKPIPIEKITPVPIKVHYEQPIPFKVFVPHPYPVEKPVPLRVEVPIIQPYPVEKEIPYPVSYPINVPIDRHIPIGKQIPIQIFNKLPFPIDKHLDQIKAGDHKHFQIDKPLNYPIKVYFASPYPVEKRNPYSIYKALQYPTNNDQQVPVTIVKHIPVSIDKPYNEDGTVQDQEEKKDDYQEDQQNAKD